MIIFTKICKSNNYKDFVLLFVRPAGLGVTWKIDEQVAHAAYSADINFATNLPIDLTAKFDRTKIPPGQNAPISKIVKLMRYFFNMS